MGGSHRSCLWLVLSGFRIHPNLVNLDFIENYSKDIDEGIFSEVNVQYPEKLHEIHNNLSLLPQRIKIQKVEKLVANLQDKKECYRHKKLKTSIKSKISLEKSP